MLTYIHDSPAAKDQPHDTGYENIIWRSDRVSNLAHTIHGSFGVF